MVIVYLILSVMASVIISVDANTVGTLPSVQLHNGYSATLLCQYNHAVYGIYWVKENGHEELGGETLVHLDMYFDIGSRSGKGVDEGRFNISDDFSLLIDPVMMQDAGWYSCIVSDIASGISYKNYTNVTVYVDVPYVGTLPFVKLLNGSSAILPCQYKHAVYEIYWVYHNGHEELGGDTLVKLDMYFDISSRSGMGLDEGRFNISDDFSLLIEPVMMQDGGLYSCIVSDIASGFSYKNYSYVTVYVYANTTNTNYVTIEQCEDSTNLTQAMVFEKSSCVHLVPDNHTVFQLNCSVYGAMPEVFLSWTTNGTNVGTNYDLTSMIEERGDGTLNLMLTMTGSVNETKNSTVFTCVAEGLSVGGLAKTSVTFIKTEHQFTVPSHGTTDPGQSPNEAAIVVPITICLVVIIVGVAVFSFRKRIKICGEPGEQIPQDLDMEDS